MGMLDCSDKSKKFLLDNIPEVLTLDNIGQALDKVYDWIDMNGFGLDGMYNAKGKEAQAVYDDLMSSSQDDQIASDAL